MVECTWVNASFKKVLLSLQKQGKIATREVVWHQSQNSGVIKNHEQY
jgi:hypothetical protein